MAVVSVTEYGRLRRGPKCLPTEAILSESQFDALERLTDELDRTRGVRPFLPGPRQTLVAQNFVGLLDLGQLQVEILPKIDVELHCVRHNLVRMIAEVVDVEFFSEQASGTNVSKDTLLDVFVRLYCAELWRLVRRGFIRRYEAQFDTLAVMRGRIDVPQQLRRNVGRPERLACTFDEFTGDNVFNRVIRLSLLSLLKRVTSRSSQAAVSELLFCFQDVRDVAPSQIRWETLNHDRLTAPWSSALRLARQFIESDSPDIGAGAGQGFALLFDMNVLFERYVGVVARRVLGRAGYRVSLQGPERHLADDAAGKPCFALRPDVIVRTDDDVALVIDTKWKRLDSGKRRDNISTDDVYQMNAYATQYRAERVMLLYPHHQGLGAWTRERAAYTLRQSTLKQPQALAVSTLELADLSRVPEQILEIAGGSGSALAPET